MQRYDRVVISATRTNEGFIRDAPAVGRAGILKYMKDGKEYLEYRPPEEAFKKDSLASLQGKPITVGHKGMVNSKNVTGIKPVGSVLSEGRREGNNIVADVVIYHLDTAARELSCGYTVDLDETPGVTPEGEHYDAVQRNIIYNHVAIVPEGRAGVARLNMDGEQEDESEEEKMSEKNYTKIRLDGGLEYEAAPEVAVYIEKIRADSKELSEKISALEVEKADALADQRKKVSGDQKPAEKNDENNPEVALAELKKAEANFYVGEGK